MFSGFAKPVAKAAKSHGVDSKEIFRELARRKVIAGQDDVIIDVAIELAKRQAEQNTKGLIC